MKFHSGLKFWQNVWEWKMECALSRGLTCSFHIYSPVSSILCELLQAMQGNDHKWVGHCEYHPDVNHLDVSSHWQGLGNSHETKTE